MLNNVEPYYSLQKMFFFLLVRAWICHKSIKYVYIFGDYEVLLFHIFNLHSVMQCLTLTVDISYLYLEMVSARLLEIFLVFSQLCHMVCLQVGNFYFISTCFSLIIWTNNYVILLVNAAAVLLKKFAGEEGERVDVQKLFGYIGLFTLVALWWLSKCLQIIMSPFFSQ